MQAAADADLLVIARDSRHPSPHSIGHAARFVVDHAPCDVRARLARRRTGRTAAEAQAEAASRSQAQAETEARTAMTPPALPARPAPPPDRGLGHAARPVLAAAARALRRHVHAARRPPRAVGRRLAPRRRQGRSSPATRTCSTRARATRSCGRCSAPRSVLLLDGPEHMRERKTLLPPFHGERMQAYGELIREIAEREVATWPTREPIARAPAHAGADARDHHARGLRHAATSSCARSSRRCWTG